MSGFSIDVRTPSDTKVYLPSRVEFEPTRWSGVAVGGCEDATIEVSGAADGVWNVTGWLGYKMRILSNTGDLCWWGHVQGVTVESGSFSVGITLDDMSNKIKVAYSYSLADGSSFRGDTDYTQDDTSIDRYGTKELQYSQGGELTVSAAEELRDSLLDQIKLPLPVLNVGGTESTARATIDCRGDFDYLNWQHYTELRGLEESNTSGNSTIPIGYGMTQNMTWIGDDKNQLWMRNAVLGGMQTGMVVDVTGDNSGTYTIAGSASGEPESVTTDITFISPRDIEDDLAKGVIGTWSTGDIITIGGSTSDDGSYRIQKIEDADEIDVKPEAISNNTDSNVTITRSYSIKVEETVTEDFDATSTIVPRGYISAQSFSLTNDVDDWTCASISIRAKKVGTPGDNLRVELRSGSASAPSGTVLASAELSAANIYDTAMGWYEFDMGNTVSLSYGTDYWIVIKRTGSNNGQSYYEIAVDEDVPYSNGVLKVYSTDTSWYDRYTDGTIPFIVKGQEPNDDQITNIVENYAQFLEDVEFIDTSTIESNQYREGDTTSHTELLDLLEMGVDSGRRYLCRVTPERNLVIWEEPEAPDIPQLALNEVGELVLNRGGATQRGMLPYGQWVAVKSPFLLSDDVARLNPYFVERAEYDASNDSTRLEPRRSDPFDIGIRQ